MYYKKDYDPNTILNIGCGIDFKNVYTKRKRVER